jgi:uncharacterized membrane protein YkvI
VISKAFRVASVAAVFMGTVIGAGFASGQEVYFFFTRFGDSGVLGILLSTLILAVLGTVVVTMGCQIHSLSHRSFFRASLGPTMGYIADGLVTLFLLILSGVMLAGSGALTHEMGLGWFTGIIITGGLALIVLSFRMNGIRGFNLLVVPLLVGTGVAVACASVRFTPSVIRGEANGWLFSAIQYGSYNLVLAIPVLSTIHFIEADVGILRWGGFFGGVGLGVVALLFNLALLRSSSVTGIELPLLPLIATFGPKVRWGFALVLWGELFTTYIANLYGLVQRWGESRRHIGYSLRLVFMVVLSAMIGRLGFSRLIHTTYPCFGLLSFLFIICGFLHYPGFMRSLREKADYTRKKNIEIST